MESPNGPRILALEDCDERAAFELPMKGWLSTQLEFEDGRRYSVYFSDPIRLQQDLEGLVASGSPCFAEPGLIVLPEVTVDAIRDTVQFLWKQGFFKELKADPIRDADQFKTSANEPLQPTPT
jgi:hypothetical protein